jgi:flagellar biosynthetic protein FlhB
MADESFQEKTEAPTPKKRQDAAKKGQVPKSQEVTTAFLLLASAGAVAWTAGPVAGGMGDIFGVTAAGLSAPTVGVDGAVGHIRAIGWKTLAGMAPVLLALAGTALAFSAVQGRGVLSADPLTPKWDKLDPLKKAKQIWGVQAIAELAKSLLKFLIVGISVYFALGTAVSDIPRLEHTHPFALLATVQSYAVRMFASAGGAYLALALADYAFQIWQHEKQLKMSREEIKRELKDAEGDQVMKVRRRTMARQMARRRMMLAVSEADVVITNPTHVAVALRYDPDTAAAPIVLAMGERKVAERIKEIARESGVPLIENKPLARALLATAQVGSAIPVELFVAVAEVLAFVYRQAGGMPHPGSGGSRR